MTTTNECPGCPQSTKGCAPACSLCVERLPEDLRVSLTDTEQLIAGIHQAVTAWLADHPRLSERELQVLRLLADGLRDDHIAHTLELSVNTIRDHIKRVIHRLGCSGRPHLMATLYRKGYLSGAETACAS